MTRKSAFWTAVLLLLVTTPLISEAAGGYKRGDWGRWKDTDGDCRTVRHEILADQSEKPVRYSSKSKCNVQSGYWTDPFTGEVLTKATEISIDHIVPLKEAHIAGGHKWSKEQKSKFYNDKSNLIAVGIEINAEKGHSGPHQWRPPREQIWCYYAERWKGVKIKYGLQFRKKEVLAIQEMLETCQ